MRSGHLPKPSRDRYYVDSGMSRTCPESRRRTVSGVMDGEEHQGRLPSIDAGVVDVEHLKANADAKTNQAGGG
jgi:hypothetical protein